MYQLQDEKWEYRQHLPASNPEKGDYFGYSIAISESGHDVIVGADGISSNTGAAYVFNQDKIFRVIPDNLTINDVFLTGNNYKNARIFANGVMQARLIQKYSYDYAPEYFPGATQGEIEEVVIPKVNSYLQDPKNLRIYLQGDENQDIIDKGWDRKYESNGYLHDLDKPSKNLQQEESSNTKIIQNREELDPYYFDIYITPPANVPLTYDLLVKLIHKTGPAANDPATLETQQFAVSKEDLEVRTISEQTYPTDNMALRVLAYKPNRFGVATLNHIDEDDYLGMVLNSNKNVCFLSLYSSTFSGILFYPAMTSGNGYPLRVADRNKIYSHENVRLFVMDNEFSLTIPLDTDLYTESDDWDRSKLFTREEIDNAHRNGIPIVSGDSSFSIYSNFLDDEDYKIKCEITLKRPLKIHDNCGNAIMVKSFWRVDEYTEDNVKHPPFEITDAYPTLS